MRGLVLPLTTMAAVLLVASGVALAVVGIGGPGPDVLRASTASTDWKVGEGLTRSSGWAPAT
jgi:hypothetical protein